MNDGILVLGLDNLNVFCLISTTFQVSNPVYNKIRNFSIKEGKRKNRLADKEDRAVAEQVT